MAELSITGFAHIFYSYNNFRKRKLLPTLAYVFDVSVIDGGATLDTHTVVAAARPDKAGEMSFWCGDKLLEGRLSRAELDKRLAVMDYSGDARASLEAIIPAAPAPVQEPCNFWELHKDGDACEHVKHVKAIVEGNHAGKLALDELARAVNAAGNFGPEELVDADIVAGLAHLVMPGADALTSVLDADRPAPAWHGTPEGTLDYLIFRSPVLLEGDKGAGKTVMARAIARQRDATLVEVQGHESVEAVDLLGHFVPAKKDLVWKDGRLSQAFRLAAGGNKVVLLLDELLRIPQRHLSVLLGALSPFDGKYTLATGRMLEVVDGVGVEETLQCPVENLAVVATTNMGMQYAVDNIDPALADRFVPVQVELEASKVRRILGEACAAKGFPEAVRDKLVKFFDKTTELYANRSIAEEPSLRVLTRCVEVVSSEADIAPMLRIHFPLLAARTSTGAPDPQQVATLEGVLKRIFK